MSTIQQQMQMYHVIEEVLKASVYPMSLGDICESAAVRELTDKHTFVRDKLKVLVRHNLVSKVPISQSATGNNMVRTGYIWAADDRGVEEIKHRERGPYKKAEGKEVIVPSVTIPAKDSPSVMEVELNGVVVYVGANVEMYISDVKCTIDKNPSTGVLRIKII